MKKLDANDEKVDAVIDFANRLANNNHYASEKILEKANDIDERWTFVELAWELRSESLHESFRLRVEKSWEASV